MPSSDLWTSEEAGQLHLLQIRDELYGSGYYCCPPTPVCTGHCLAWLNVNLDGPYAGKHDHIAKLSYTLGDDNLAGFMKFYTGLRAGLNACGFNPHLLPLLYFYWQSLVLNFGA
jgi:hypothetical protein